MKPFAGSCEQNKDPILSVLKPLLNAPQSVLEIGSGTGQHAVYFGQALPHIQWFTSDLPEHHFGIRQWLDEAALCNVFGPLALDVNQADWGTTRYSTIFSANAVHIMGWSSVEKMFLHMPDVLEADGQLLLYGPFNYEGKYTSPSNEQFDAWLKARDPESGIRDFEALDALARDAGLTLANDFAMPANNRILHWQAR